jgi:hypothetical protein
MDEHRGYWSAVGVGVMALGFGGLVAWKIAVSTSSSVPKPAIPALWAVVLLVVGFVGLYGMLAPLLHWWPWRRSAEQNGDAEARPDYVRREYITRTGDTTVTEWEETQRGRKELRELSDGDAARAVDGGEHIQVIPADPNAPPEPIPPAPPLFSPPPNHDMTKFDEMREMTRPMVPPVAPQFDFYTEPQRIDENWVVNGRKALDNVALWVHVRNDGPTAQFFARVTDVRGIDHPTAGKDIWRSPTGEHYRVPQPAWEHTDASRVEIDGYGGERKLRLGNVSRNPRTLWFYTVEKGKREAGNQYVIEQLGITGPVTITFDLTVVVIRDGLDYPNTKSAVLTIPDNQGVLHGPLPAFDWVTP